MSVDPRWYESFFETEEWLLMATTRDPERTEREVAFVASHLESGARVLMLENRTHDIVTGRSQAFWTFLKDGEKRELAFDHRLYTLAEYGELLARAGFGERHVFGSHDTAESTMDKFRIQVVARKQ